MNIHKEHTTKLDRQFRDNPFAKSYSMKMKSHEAVRGLNSKVEILKKKKK